MTATELNLVKTVVDALEDVKGIDIMVFEVAELTDVADQMVIATGSSKRQVKALADRVLEKCRDIGIKPIGVEGKDSADWILIDFASVIVHILVPDAREFYDLERLWMVTSERRNQTAPESGET